MTETIAIERVDHIGIRVRDLERALAFYRVLGFSLAHRSKGDHLAIVRNEHGVDRCHQVMARARVYCRQPLSPNSISPARAAILAVAVTFMRRRCGWLAT